MACYYPLDAYQSKCVGANGRHIIRFDHGCFGHHDYTPIKLPCGQCVGCRLERSRQWAIRCMHEASLHEQNSFITLTYADEHLPKNHSLQFSDFQKFIKRLRKNISPQKLRFFHCGEYGSNFGRPHYHACIFGYQFPDLELYKISQGNTRLYNSQVLSRLWPYGYSVVGEVTFESAAYVARYIMKKITGDKAIHHYNNIDMATGEVLSSRSEEYTTMSRRPGIGKGWFDQFKDDVYRIDGVVVKGHITRPPRYYDSQYELLYPDEMTKIKTSRNEKAMAYVDDQTPERLAVKEIVTKAKLSKLKRNLP